MTQDTSDAPIPSTVDDVLNDSNAQGDSGQGDDTTREIQKLQEEINQLREQLARSQADYSNMVRRNREEAAQIGEWSENKIIIKFLPILDNLERALEHTPAEFQSHTWMEGITSIVRSMQKVLNDIGVVRMNCVGQEINPDLHDVISQIPHVNTTIQSEVENGYIRNEKAIRHAKVIVGDGSLS